MLVRSPKWGTVTLPTQAFKQLARPLSGLLNEAEFVMPFQSTPEIEVDVQNTLQLEDFGSEAKEAILRSLVG
jgi:hypothetical protein